MVESGPPMSVPALLQGRYRVGVIIGRGGASIVYRASDLLLGRDVAVKVFTARAAQPQGFLRVQEGEARLLGGLNHPGLVTLFDAGIDTTDASAPQAFMIMEYVDGPDLRRRLRQGALTAFEVCYLGWDLLGGLSYVHERGIVHRDMKPANVLLAGGPRERPPFAKLADFGIAVFGGYLETGGETTGTAAYLSPEQVDGRPLTSSTDIYSLGLVLLEALTGRIAFPGDPIESALARLDRDPVIPASVPNEIASVIHAMTAQDPSARPSAGEAASAFRAVIVRELGGHSPQVSDPERERVAAVRDHNLVGTPPDAEFDRITALAARMFQVQVAVISIVDEDRVWLKSQHGLDVQELPRTGGLGSTGSLHDQTLIIEDTLSDPRTAQLASARESPFRFYAGVPLITMGGHNLGTFAIADTSPRPMTGTDIASLEDLAALALHEIELRRSVRRVAHFD